MGQGAVSSQSVDQVAEDIKSMLDDELLDDEEESPSPLKINKPTLVVPQIQPKQPSIKNTSSSK